MPGVTQLIIIDSEVSDATLEKMNRWTKVEILVISSCPNISDAGLARLGRFPLKSIAIKQTPVTQAGLLNLDLSRASEMSIDHTMVAGAELDKWPQLSSLHELRVGDDQKELHCKDLQLLRCCGEIRELTIDPPIDDGAMKSIVALSKLEKLALRSGVSDRHIQLLDTCKRLNTLWLEGNYTGEELNSLSRCPILVGVFRSNHLRDSALADLSRIPTIAILQFTSPHLKGSGFEHFRGSSKITALFLYNASVTDDDIDLFLSLPNLHSLRLDETMITEHGRNRIKAARPDLQLTWFPRSRAIGK